MTRVAIMQPTYLPWLGYFSLMQSVDTFVILDTVQFAKRSWQQRNQIKTSNGVLMLTVPVQTKGKHDQLVNEVLIDYDRKYPRDHIKSIELNYRKSNHYKSVSEPIFAILEKKTPLLMGLTVDLISWIRSELKINTTIRFASEFDIVGSKADYLASLCSLLNATEYVSPPGSKAYLDQSNSFQELGIPFSYFEFVHPEYKQLFGEFIPYMSIIDLMFNCGSASLNHIKQDGITI